MGIAGITLGGGIGLVDRAYGLSCDALVSAEVVTADGRILVDENLMTPRRPELIAAPPRIAASSPQTRTALGYLSTNQVDDGTWRKITVETTDKRHKGRARLGYTADSK